jgi:hypothetical protein
MRRTIAMISLALFVASPGSAEFLQMDLSIFGMD